MYKDSMTEQAVQIVCRWWPRMCTRSISMYGWWSTGSCAHLPGPRSRRGVCGRLLEQMYRSRAHSRIASGTGAGCLTSPPAIWNGPVSHIHTHAILCLQRNEPRRISPVSGSLVVPPIRTYLASSQVVTISNYPMGELCHESLLGEGQ